MKISVCIPTYEMHGKARELLVRSFDMLEKQTYKDFEIIISDNSEDDVVKNLCEDEKYKSLDIKYSKNPRKGLSVNTNKSMKKANGELIKILYMDDYLADEHSLAKIAENFRGSWMVTACGHDNGDGQIINTHFPKYTEKIYMGKNTIGSPSVVTIKNENILFFDESLSWMLDCDYYRKLYDRYGEPNILNEINVIIGIGKHQTTHHLNYLKKIKERVVLWRRYYLNKLFKLW